MSSKHLQERIQQEGRNLGNGILKVDSLINHQVDPVLMLEAGRDLARQLGYLKPDRILTAETSGILPALATAAVLEIPFVYARKKRPITMNDPVICESTPSHTKGGSVSLLVSQEYLKPNERILIIDDFLAAGHTIHALIRIAQKASATVVGVGVLVEKTFENGRQLLGQLDVPIVSLVSIAAMNNDGSITITPPTH